MAPEQSVKVPKPKINEKQNAVSLFYTGTENKMLTQLFSILNHEFIFDFWY